MGSRNLFVYNPNAGKKKVKELLADIIDRICETDGVQLIVAPTRKRGDAEEIVFSYDHDMLTRKVICSGGDGTLHEVVNGMMRRQNKVPIVYIPAGSTNDFGASLSIPGDMKLAASMASDGEEYAIDILSVNEIYCVYTACFGLFTETSYATPQKLKNVFGHFAYVLNSAGEILSKVKKYKMTVEYDGNVVTDTFIFGAVTSSSSMGGFKGVTGKDVQYNDGYYELMLIRDGSVFEVPAVLHDILAGKYNHKRVLYTKVRNVKFTSVEEVPWCVDGEFAGSLTEVDMHVNQQAVKLVIPKQAVEDFERLYGEVPPILDDIDYLE